MVTAEPKRTRRRWWAWSLCILIAACVVLSLPWASALRHDSAVWVNRTGRSIALGPLADWVAVDNSIPDWY
ncbi:MAG: hypothetical protein ACR2NP_04780, partial [Pirellulaceae bacterium]